MEEISSKDLEIILDATDITDQVRLERIKALDLEHVDLIEDMATYESLIRAKELSDSLKDNDQAEIIDRRATYILGSCLLDPLREYNGY